MTVLKNITLAPVRLGKWNAAEADQKARALLKRVGLEEKSKCISRQAFRWSETASGYSSCTGHES